MYAHLLVRYPVTRQDRISQSVSIVKETIDRAGRVLGCIYVISSIRKRHQSDPCKPAILATSVAITVYCGKGLSADIVAGLSWRILPWWQRRMVEDAVADNSVEPMTALLTSARW